MPPLGRTLAESTRFDTFANAVLGPAYTAARAVQVKDGFGKWVAQFGEFMDMSLPAAATPWGAGQTRRLRMIFNRIAARDLGIRDNYKVADAPVRYPFLWNAHGRIAPNGTAAFTTDLYPGTWAQYRRGARSLRRFRSSSVVGPTPLTPAVIDFKYNPIDFAGLQTLEEKIAVLRPPPWPREIFGLDEQLAAAGEPLFDANCGRCHTMQKSPDSPDLWRTPVLAVGTDPKMLINSQRASQPGLLMGALMPPPAVGARIGDPAKAGDLLAKAVVGSIFAKAFVSPIPSPGKLAQSGFFRALRKDFAEHLPGEHLDTLLDPRLSPNAKIDALVELRRRRREAKRHVHPPPAVDGAAYELRVLNGVWAAAPYLHNGSVPNLGN